MGACAAKSRYGTFLWVVGPFVRRIGLTAAYKQRLVNACYQLHAITSMEWKQPDTCYIHLPRHPMPLVKNKCVFVIDF